MSEVLILGAGVSGLTAGIYCLMAGHKVTICEQHTIPGGNLTGWTRQKLHIDNCIHWLTGTNKHSFFNRIWHDIGALGDNIPLIKEDSLYTYNCNGTAVTLYRNLDKTIEEMLRVAPEDHDEILKLKKAIKVLERCNHTGGEDFSKGVNFKTIVRMPMLLRYWKRTTREYGELYKSPAMRGFFEGLLGPDFSAIAFLMVAATYCSGNGDIPEGGSFSMAQRVAKKFKELGGEIKFFKKALKVSTDGNRVSSVTFEDGEVIKADNVIVTFEPKMFFEKIMDKKLPKEYKRLYRGFKRFSTIQTAFAVPADSISFSGSMSIDIPGELREGLHSDKALLRESAYEKSFVKDGKKVLQSMIYVDEEFAKYFIEISKIEGKEQYREEKKKLGDMQKDMIEKLFPEMEGKLELIDNWTPASYARYVGTEIGSWMSFIMPAKKIPVFVKGKVKGMQNLFFASQWQMMPGGLPLAALAGKNTAKMIK